MLEQVGPSMTWTALRILPWCVSPIQGLTGMRLIRQFITFAEAAEMLGTDAEGLRQALEFGLGDYLPVYLYATGTGFLACFVGGGVQTRDDFIDGWPSCTVTIPEFGEFTDNGGTKFDWMNDPFCSVAANYKDKSETGVEFCLDVKGYLRVIPSQLLDCARSPSQGIVTIVAPTAWWSVTSPVPKAPDGNPEVELMLLPRPHEGYKYLPKCSDLMFRIADIEAMKSSETDVILDREKKPLDPRKRTTLLAIIGALATEVKLDLSQPYKAGQVVEALLDARGVKLSARSIGNCLKEAGQAMDDRKS